MSNLLNRFERDEAGNFAIITALVMPLLVGIDDGPDDCELLLTRDGTPRLIAAKQSASDLP